MLNRWKCLPVPRAPRIRRASAAHRPSRPASTNTVTSLTLKPWRRLRRSGEADGSSASHCRLQRWLDVSGAGAGATDVGVIRRAALEIAKAARAFGASTCGRSPTAY